MSGERKLKPSMQSYLLMFASDAWCQKLVCFIKQHCTCRFGLTKQALKDVDELLEGVTKKVHQLTLSSQALAAASPPESLLGKCIICHSLTAFGTFSEKKHQLLETSLHVHVHRCDQSLRLECTAYQAMQQQHWRHCSLQYQARLLCLSRF